MLDAQAPESPPDHFLTRRHRVGIAALFSVLYLLILSFTSLSTVFPSGKSPRLAGPDAYYHLRHAEAVAANYPHILRPDPMTSFPTGETGINQGGFDLAVATLSKISLGLLSPKAILIVISPLCALLACLWVANWLSREAGDLPACLFLLFSLAYPGSLNVVAALGQGDHHAFEVLMAVAIAWSLSWLFRVETSPKMAPLAALPLILLYFSWAGAALQLLMVGGVFYFRAWNPDIDDKTLNRKGALYGLTLVLVVGLMDQLVPWLTIWRTSYRLFLLAGILLTVGYPVLVALAGRLRRYPALGAFGFLFLALLGAMAHPVTREYLGLLGEERSSAISEHSVVTLGLLYRWFGPLPLLAVLGLLALVWKKRLWWASVPLIYAGGLLFFWLYTKDFVYYSPIAVAAAAAYALSLQRAAKFALAVAVPIACLSLLGSTGVQSPWIPVSLAQETMLVTNGLESASEWLHKNYENRDSGDDYGLVAPWDLGNILAQTAAVPVGWSQTHSPLLSKILYADQPDIAYKVLTGGEKPFRYIYLPARNLSEKYITELGLAGVPLGAEFTAERTLKWQDRPVTTLKTLPRHDLALLNRLYWKKGEDLGHYRLVFETPEKSLHTQKLYPATNSVELHSSPVDEKALKALQPLLDFPNVPLETSRGVMVRARVAPEVRIFEIVAGAVIVGQAAPKSVVTAELELYSPASKAVWTTTWSTKADAKGDWSLRLPYPTDQPISTVSGTVRVRGNYRLEVGKRLLTFPLSEAMIRNGSTLKLGEKNL